MATNVENRSGPLIQLIYASQAVRPMSSAELMDLLVQARDKNKRLDITGMLLYKQQGFLQVLEGSPDAVRDVYASIRNDHRHRAVHTLLEKEVDGRQFADWTMGFCDLDESDHTSVPGYTGFLDEGFDSLARSNRGDIAHSLLVSFRDMAV